jgi:hypothetical protein
MAIDSDAPAQRRPRFVWFDGILTGPREAADGVALEVEQANREGLVSISVDTEPARVSLLLSDRTVDGGRVIGDCRETFTTTMRRIVAAAPARPWESTFRCTEVFEDEVRESLFTVRGGDVVCLSRARPPRPEDLTRAPRRVEPPEPRNYATLGIVAALLLVAFGLTAWRAGWIDRVLAASARSLTVETGPLTGLVDAKVAESWGTYEVSIARGKDYPRTKEQAEALTKAASTPVAAAAASAVVDGSTIYVRLETAEGDVLAFESVSLRGLLTRETVDEAVKLPGRIAARKLVIGLDEGKRPR